MRMKSRYNVQLAATYNRIAEDWHREHKSDDWWIEGTNEFAQLLPSKATVLDVGCGAGIESKYLASKGLQVTGIDFSQNMLVIARREVPEATFTLCSIEDSASLQKTFDGVFAQAVLLHIAKAKVKTAIRTLVSLIKPGGLIYIAVKRRRARQPEEHIIEEDDYGYTYERFFSYYEPEEIKKAMQAAGLTVCYEDIGEYGSTKWLQIIGRKQL